ncbi:MAG: aspartate/glutamate racemase family protein [Chloroflexi bacterium]|nr:aspartate/glutamate racemase family protein [Chloroflexota bacterium]
MAILRGGRTVYGQALGILMLDTRFPRPPGDVGNALTWPFPTQYRIVKGAHQSRIMGSEPDPTLLTPFLEAARDLEAHGVGTITTSCGFLAAFHQELAAAVSVPVLTSSLLQVPLVSRLLRPDQKVGVLTERPHLTERHFKGVGWSPETTPVVVASLPPDAVFPTVFIDNGLESDTAILEREMVTLAERVAREHPEVGAFVLECTNFVPYSQAMRRATGLPVYDLYTLVMQTYLATAGRDF